MSVCHHVAHGRLLKTQFPAVDLVLLWSLCQNKENLQARQEKVRAGFAWALTEPPSACGFQLVCSLIQRRLPLHFFWGLCYWKCARLGGQNLYHHRLSGSNFQFFFFLSGSSGVITLQNKLKRLCPGIFWKRYRGSETQSSQFSNLMKCANFDVSQFPLDHKTLHKSELWLFFCLVFFSLFCLMLLMLWWRDQMCYILSDNFTDPLLTCLLK